MRDERSGKVDAKKELEFIRKISGTEEKKKETKKMNSGQLEKTLENFIDELPTNTQKIDLLTKILSKSLTNESLKNLGLDITIDEIKKQLESCKNIKSGADFIKKVKEVFKDISISMDKHPEEFNKLQRKIFVEYHNFTPLNEVFSYRIDGGDLHLHLAPASDLNTGKKIKAIKDALDKLIEIVSKNSKIKEISATSWIVANNPKLLEKIGFKIKEISDEVKKRDFKGETHEIKRAVLSRKEFLKKYQKNRQGYIQSFISFFTTKRK